MIREFTLAILIAFILGCGNVGSPTAPSSDNMELDSWEIQPARTTHQEEVGTSDDIQAAVDAAGDGETIHLMAGRYRVTAEILISKPVTLRGRSGTVLTLSDGVSSSVIGLFGTPEHPIRGVRIQNLTIAGGRRTQRAGSGISMVNVTGCELRNLRIGDCFEDGVYLSGARSCLFDNLVLSRNGRHGIAFGEASEAPNQGNEIRNCRSRGNGLHGFDGEPVRETFYENCVAILNSGDGFHIGAEAQSFANRLLQCQSMRNGRFGIMIWADSTVVDQCDMRGNELAGIHISGPIATGNSVTGCSVIGNGWHGISLDRTTRARVEGNSVLDNAMGGSGDGIALVTSIPVYGNSITGNVSRGARWKRFSAETSSRVRFRSRKERS